MIRKTASTKYVQVELSKLDLASSTPGPIGPTGPAGPEGPQGPAGTFIGTMDDIIDGTTYKKVSQTEKNTWNAKLYRTSIMCHAKQWA